MPESLSPVVHQNLNAMMAVGSGDLLDIVALTDTSGDQDSHLIHVTKDKLVDKGLNNIKIQSPGEVDTGNPRTLTDFGRWTFENYPSEHYLLIMWGHGKGWKGLATDKGDSLLSISEFNESLRDLVMANGGQNIDIIGFDACTMATMEGYFQIAPYADYLVASEKKEPDAGWPYETIFKDLKQGKISGPEGLVKKIVDEYVKAYEDGDLPDQDFSVGMTGMRTKEDSAFTVSFQRFAKALDALDGEDRAKALALRDEAPVFENKDDVDLLAYAEAVSGAFLEGSAVRDAADDLLREADAIIVKEGHWDNPDSDIRMTGARGICIHLPEDGLDTAYKDTYLAQATYWDDFLKTG